MKQLFMSVVTTLCLIGCGQRGHINFFEDGTCIAYGSANFEKHTQGNTVTCSVTFEKKP